MHTFWEWVLFIHLCYNSYLGIYPGDGFLHNVAFWHEDFMKDADCSLVDNLIAKKLILPTFRLDAPVLLKARVKLSRGT